MAKLLEQSSGTVLAGETSKYQYRVFPGLLHKMNGQERLAWADLHEIIRGEGFQK